MLNCFLYALLDLINYYVKFLFHVFFSNSINTSAKFISKVLILLDF